MLMKLILIWSGFLFAVFSEHWRFCYQQLGMRMVDLWFVDLLFVEVDLLVGFNLRLLDVHCICKWSCWILLSVSIYGLLISISDLIIFSFRFPICISRQLRIQFQFQFLFIYFKLREPREGRKEGRGENENIYNFGDTAHHTETVTHVLALAYIRTIKRLLHGNPYSSLLRVDPKGAQAQGQ